MSSLLSHLQPSTFSATSICQLILSVTVIFTAGRSMGLPCCATTQSAKQDGTIPTSARRIASISGWAIEPDYYWLDPNRILHYQHSKLPFELKKLDRLQPDEGDIFVYMVKANRDEKAQSLSRVFKKNECVRIGRTISPDGKWVASVSFKGGSRAKRIRIRSLVCQVDGSSIRSRPEMSIVWMPDSLSFLGFHPYASNMKQRTRVDLYRVDRTVPVQSFVIPYDDQASPLDFDSAVVSKDGRFFAPVGTWVVPRGDVMIFEWSPKQPKDKGSIKRISVPEEYQVREAVLSPGGNQIAWILRTRPSAKRMVLDSIWVSQIDGSQLREISRLREGDNRAVSFLKWLPSGSQVSFVYRTELYTLSIQPRTSNTN